MTLVEELRERGLLQDIIPGTEEVLEKETIKAYIGYDPTAPSLTIGNLVTIMLLVHLQRHGHVPVVLFGGATGRVGDPSGKDAERKLLDVEVIEENLARQKSQFNNLLKFEGVDNAAVMVNNYDWFRDIGFLEFLRDAGKHLTVNYMMSKESVKRRIESGISFTEFSYQLLQGFDFYHMYEEMGVKMQMGGSDQWGNITTGTEFIRRKTGGEAYALTCPLLTRADGTKFGKSEGQNIWLDPNMTSPYKFYQFFLNTTDEEAAKYLLIFSISPLDELKEVIREHGDKPGARIAQKRLAEDVTSLLHGAESVQKAQDISRILFGKASTDDLAQMSDQDLIDAFDGLPIHHNSKDQLDVTLLNFLAENTSICSSKGEARRALKGNAISVNKEKIRDSERNMNSFEPMNGRFLLIQNGKKNHHLVILD